MRSRAGHHDHVTPSSAASELLRPRRLGGADVPLLPAADEWRDLAPDILRQRLVIEGVPARPVDDEQIRDYLSALSREVDMVQLIEPVTHRSDLYGWAGWIHWETSGAHFYAWEQPRLFFSVDIYTCKAFDVDTAVAFTRGLLRRRTPSSRSPSDVALRLLVAHTPAERDAARRVEAAVFLQAFGNTPEVMDAEYGPYEAPVPLRRGHRRGERLRPRRRPADPLRPGELPVKTLVDMAGEPVARRPRPPPSRAAGLAGGPVWDVASLAVDRAVPHRRRGRRGQPRPVPRHLAVPAGTAGSRAWSPSSTTGCSRCSSAHGRARGCPLAGRDARSPTWARRPAPRASCVDGDVAAEHPGPAGPTRPGPGRRRLPLHHRRTPPTSPPTAARCRRARPDAGAGGAPPARHHRVAAADGAARGRSRPDRLTYGVRVSARRR